MKAIVNITVIVCMLMLPAFVAAGDIATLRDAPLTDIPDAPRLQEYEDSDKKRQRNYPMQPPTIPHKIDGYVVDLNSNRCLSCHHRRRTEESQAPMVSVTHYMDRDGNFLAEVSPRRYFCSQCHVPQMPGGALIGNTFEDVTEMISKPAQD